MYVVSYTRPYLWVGLDETLQGEPGALLVNTGAGGGFGCGIILTGLGVEAIFQKGCNGSYNNYDNKINKYAYTFVAECM